MSVAVRVLDRVVEQIRRSARGRDDPPGPAAQRRATASRRAHARAPGSRSRTTLAATRRDRPARDAAAPCDSRSASSSRSSIRFDSRSAWRTMTARYFFTSSAGRSEPSSVRRIRGWRSAASSTRDTLATKSRRRPRRRSPKHRETPRRCRAAGPSGNAAADEIARSSAPSMAIWRTTSGGRCRSRRASCTPACRINSSGVRPTSPHRRTSRAAVVGEHDATFGVHHQHAFDHAREHGLQLFLLGRRFTESALKLVRHGVESVCDATGIAASAPAQATIEFSRGHVARKAFDPSQRFQQQAHEDLRDPERCRNAGAGGDGDRLPGEGGRGRRHQRRPYCERCHHDGHDGRERREDDELRARSTVAHAHSLYDEGGTSDAEPRHSANR